MTRTLTLILDEADHDAVREALRLLRCKRRYAVAKGSNPHGAGVAEICREYLAEAAEAAPAPEEAAA